MTPRQRYWAQAVVDHIDTSSDSLFKYECWNITTQFRRIKAHKTPKTLTWSKQTSVYANISPQCVGFQNQKKANIVTFRTLFFISTQSFIEQPALYNGSLFIGFGPVNSWSPKRTGGWRRGVGGDFQRWEFRIRFDTNYEFPGLEYVTVDTCRQMTWWVGKICLLTIYDKYANKTRKMQQ